MQYLPRTRAGALALCCLALSAAAQSSDSTLGRPSPAPAYPGVLPVICAAEPHTNTHTFAINHAMLADLQAGDFSKRETAVAALVRIGTPALPALRELADKAGADAAWWVRATIQQIEGTAAQSEGTSAFVAGIPELLAQGLTTEVLANLAPLSPAATGALVEKYLRLEIGMDCLYSLRPAQVLPRAVELLQVQTDPFYQAMLLRLIRNVLERALLPPPGTPAPGDPRKGIAYVSASPEVAAAVRPFLTHPHPLLRREALLIMAWGQIPAGRKVQKAVLQDPDPIVAREERRLQGLLDTGAAATPDPDIASWIKACTAALNQDTDGLAQLGAYYALYELVGDFPAELAGAVAVTEGRAKDAIAWLLSQDAAGRAYLLRAGWERFPEPAPATLRKLLALREYDLKRQNIQESHAYWPEPTRALLWRNYINDTAACGCERLSGAAANRNREFLSNLDALGQGKLGAELTNRMSRPLAAVTIPAFEPWYQICASNAFSTRLPVATGAIRGLLVSDLAGARALVKCCGNLAVGDLGAATRPSFARDLIVLHPCVDLLGDNELSAPLRELWRARGLPPLPAASTERTKLAADPLQMPTALWGFLMQNNAFYMNLVGRYLATTLSLRHLPLLVALLEYNPRATVFLAELDARDAVPAITREVLSRRKSYYLSYNHDLFHGVAHFGILDAAPVVETYTKQDTNWPDEGAKTLAGYEKSRYCWTLDIEAAATNPLAAGILNEIMGSLRAGRRTCYTANDRVRMFCERGLARMGVVENTDAKPRTAGGHE